jgi:tetratricopeptide (TPR) repeat protein/tRNA A-37 threonylcarbamoyl transferase component Bud32
MPANAVPTAETDDRIDSIITDYLESVERGESSDPQLWIGRYPEFAEELDRFFAAERRFDRILSPFRTASIGSTAPNGGSAPGERRPIKDVKDYDLLEEIGRGGMGVIYQARQRSLNRLVAVKMIRSAEWATPAERLRFRWEAEAVAALDHPNIVPIYEIGEFASDDGAQLPFFSMKLIEGGNLASRRDQFRGQWKEIARLLVQIARAVEHAHQRGIQHRDLKPANILLSAPEDSAQPVNGVSPHITDFGLAARAQQQMGQTVDGTIVGTPSYLAPELASGKQTATIASDVYALGAILYELLTGEPPFKAATALETLQLLNHSVVQAPRKLNPAIPQDLETICLKCLEREPASRYRSAGKLADDLELFVSGRPISARPVGSFTAFQRWCVRQPVIAGLGAALVLSVAICLPLIVWNWRRAVEHENIAQAHLAEACVERERANDGFKLAHNAFEDLFRMLGAFDSEELTETQALNKELLERGLNYYREFVDRRQDDPTLGRELGAAMFRIAVITYRIKSSQEAIAAFDSTIEFLRTQAEQHPEDVKILETLSRSLSLKAHALSQLGRKDDAVLASRNAVEVWQRLASGGAVSSADGQRSLGIALMERGLALQRTGDWAGALESYTTAKATLLNCSEPGRVQSPLVHCLLNVGSVHSQNNQLDLAQQNIREAKEIAARLFSQFPYSEEARLLMGQSQHETGRIELKRGNLPAARDAFLAARDQFEGLVRAKPRLSHYKELQAATSLDLANVEKQMGRPSDELKAIEQAIQQLRELSEAASDDRFDRSQLGRAAYKLGEAYWERKDYAAAARAFEESRKHRRILVASGTPTIDARTSLGLTCFRLGNSYFNAKKPHEALAAFQEAADSYRGVLREQDHATSRKHLSSSLGNSAIVLRDLSRPTEALAATEERLALWPRNPDELYDAALDFARTYNLLVSKDQWGPEWRSRAVLLCVQALEKAREAGLPNLDAVNSEPLFEKIRSTDEVKLLLSRP